MNQQKISELSGTALDYAFAKAMGYEITGDQNGPFTMYNRVDRVINYFGDAASICLSSFRGNLADKTLSEGLYYGATLYTENGVAKCDLQGITVEGKDYLEALLRALAIHLSRENS